MVIALTGIAGTTSAVAASASTRQPTSAHTARYSSAAPRGISTSRLAKRLAVLFAKSHDLPRSAVAGMRAGSLHTARQGHVDWAYARFVPSSTADSVEFQDGGDVGVFERTGESWLSSRSSVANGCAIALPPAIAAVWGLNKPSLCQQASPRERPKAAATTTTGIGPIALSQVGVTDDPATKSFSPESADCNPYTAIESNAPTCNANSTITNPDGSTTTVQNQGEWWCSDFAKWVWSWDGQPDLGALGPGADSFYTWVTTGARL
jgi:hypothetical protein